MKKSICTHCYHQNNCPVDPNYKAECAPAIITTCTDYDPKQDYYEQINDITVPMSQVPEEIKQQWIQEYREPFGNDDYDAPDFSNYVQEEEPDDY